ncbi:amino acid permease [Schlesneria paludicola]|uniref:amino acid permease n=1 Tax=Schlesneria paludicola TaxID=360056 RepID=UPI00029B1A0D|nr:amino acid permease [Schlesneria paludicola]
MLVQGNRPRQLHWYHAGPMLFGDWGTSRLYVLGLCFMHAGHASLWFMLAMSCLLVAVGWAYSVICRLYPDGGGVYSSAKHKSQSLAVFGALLLGADYVVTAALSALDAFHYLDVPYPALCAAASIAVLGIVNVFGPTKGGTAALVAAVLTIIFSLIIGVASIPWLPHAHVTLPTGSPISWWTQFTGIILAISGVEAVANMTGIMVEPVEKTARRAIWPVLIEIVILNLFLTLAVSAIPLDILGDGNPANAYTAHRDDMLRLLATYYVGPTFAAVASIVFALLLLSAVNTAVTDLVSIQYMMARDRELPHSFSGLNRWGMPLIPLAIAVGVPLITVLIVPDVGHLADLYAIGVVGAVAVNLGSCVTSMNLPLKKWERIIMGMLAVLMIAVWISIAYEKPHALIFAGVIVAIGMTARWLTHHREAIGGTVTSLVGQFIDLKTPAAIENPTHQVRFLVATQGSPKLIAFALEQAKSFHAEVLFLYVRHIAVPMIGPAHRADIANDHDAQKAAKQIQEQAEAAGVPIRFLYTVADNIAETIVDFAVTYGVSQVIVGTTKRGTLWRTMKGDVIQGIAMHLPDRTQLLIHA